MQRTLVVAVIVVSIFLVLVFQLEAQAQIILGHITGIVTDAVTGLPIDNATVTATIDSTIKGTAMTNGTGYYNIGGLNGNFTGIVYNVTAIKIGYNASSVLVTMYSSIDFVVSVSQNFTLTPAPPIPEFPISAIPLLTFLVSSLLLVFLAKTKKQSTLSRSHGRALNLSITGLEISVLTACNCFQLPKLLLSIRLTHNRVCR